MYYKSFSNVWTTLILEGHIVPRFKKHCNTRNQDTHLNLTLILITQSQITSYQNFHEPICAFVVLEEKKLELFSYIKDLKSTNCWLKTLLSFCAESLAIVGQQYWALRLWVVNYSVHQSTTQNMIFSVWYPTYERIH